jgi:integrase
MPRPFKKPPIVCDHFVWHLRQRGGVYYADGRFNTTDLGKHSLGTRHHGEAMENLRALDRKLANQQGKIASQPERVLVDLPIAEGWRLYMDDRDKPQMFGGVSPDTLKRYRTVRDHHVKFCARRGIEFWQQVDAKNVEAFGMAMARSSADRTIYFAVTHIKTVVIWLINQKKLAAEYRIDLPLVKPDGTDTYCYTIEQMTTMVFFCRADPKLRWLADVIVGLACTGLRISEFASLRWTDADLQAEVIRLTDERWSHRRKKIGSARHTKGKRTRCLPIHPDLLAILKTLERKPDGLIFHGPQGKKLCDSSVRANLVDRVIEKLKAKFPTPPGEIGFEHGRVHSIRHYFCSESFRNGATEAQLLEWLGHRDSKMVAHYRHLRADDSKRLMRGMRLLDLNRDEEQAG